MLRDLAQEALREISGMQCGKAWCLCAYGEAKCPQLHLHGTAGAGYL